MPKINLLGQAKNNLVRETRTGLGNFDVALFPASSGDEIELLSLSPGSVITNVTVVVDKAFASGTVDVNLKGATTTPLVSAVDLTTEDATYKPIEVYTKSAALVTLDYSGTGAKGNILVYVNYMSPIGTGDYATLQ